MVNLNNAPQVIPKRRVIRVGGEEVGSRETVVQEIGKQSVEDLRFIIREIVHDEVRTQDRIDNEATRLAVDSREHKPLQYVERRAEVDFGNYIDMLVIRTIKRELINAIRNTTGKRTGKLQNINNWEWVYFQDKGSKGRRIKPSGKIFLNMRSKLVLRPTARIPYASWANWKVAQRGQSFTPTRGKNKGVTRTTNQGFMAQSIAKMKRNRLFKAYTIWISFSKKYKAAGDTYPHGSPTIVLYAKRKARSYRIIR